MDEEALDIFIDGFEDDAYPGFTLNTEQEQRATGVIKLKSIGAKLHPPIHKGCDCRIEPVEERRPAWKPTMARTAADMWAVDSVEKRAFYHGTLSDRVKKIKKAGFKDSFIASHTGNAGFLGKGHYFSVHERYAKQYGELLETRVNIKNPKLFKNTDAYVRWLEENKIPNPVFMVGDPIEIPETIAKVLKKQGYDSVMMANGTELVVFDAKNIVVVE